MKNRVLAWDGCVNVRDLGGLRTSDGRITRRGAMVRSDTPARLTAAGWSALHAHGIRTILTLRTDGMVEEELNVRTPFADIAVVQVAIEDIGDAAFVQQWVESNLWSTPLYYQDALQRWPARHAAAIAAIAQAQPGGVLFHCIRGHDRTGIIAMLLLAVAGVQPETIAEDYALSPDPQRDAFLKNQGASSREVILAALASLDIETYLLAAGLSRLDLDTVRERLLQPMEADL
jgi:hypothetical protein